MPQSLLTYKGGGCCGSLSVGPVAAAAFYLVDLPGLLNEDIFENTARVESLHGLRLVGVEVELSPELGL